MHIACTVSTMYFTGTCFGNDRTPSCRVPTLIVVSMRSARPRCTKMRGASSTHPTKSSRRASQPLRIRRPMCWLHCRSLRQTGSPRFRRCPNPVGRTLRRCNQSPTQKGERAGCGRCCQERRLSHLFCLTVLYQTIQHNPKRMWIVCTAQNRRTVSSMELASRVGSKVYNLPRPLG